MAEEKSTQQETGIQNERKLSETEINEAWQRLQARVKQEQEADAAVASILAWVEDGAKRDKARKKSMGLRTAAVAAILALVMVVVPPAFGAESILDVIVNWTESVFSISTQGTGPSVTESSQTVLYQDNNEGLTQLRNKLKEYGVAEQVVPTWIPEGFKVNKITSYKSDDGSDVISGVFKYKENILNFYFQIGTTDNFLGERDSVSFQEYIHNNIAHYVLSNNHETKCLWINGDVRCMLNGNISEDELYTILDSIYSVQEETQ